MEEVFCDTASRDLIDYIFGLGVVCRRLDREKTHAVIIVVPLQCAREIPSDFDAQI